MTDKVAEILRQYRVQSVAAAPVDTEPTLSEDDFDDKGYLWKYPDVAEGIARGLFVSAYAHYKTFGLQEGRKPARKGEDTGKPFALTARLAGAHARPVHTLSHDCDRVIISRNGGVLLIGWVDDVSAPIHHVQLVGDGWTLSFDGAALLRSRRQDVERALATANPHPYGFAGVLFVDRAVPQDPTCKVVLTLRNGAIAETTATPSHVTDLDLRDTILTHLASLQFYGNPQVEIIGQLGAGFGTEIVKLNRAVTREIVGNPYVQSFGRPARKKKGSIVVCLYGKAEFTFLQSALFSRGAGIEDYEFIYVSNSPELAETLIRDVDMCAEIYGLNQTVVLLPGNAGFGAANNAAARAARSDRMMAVNPDVFPRDLDWAQKHTEILATNDAARTKMFGAPLYYDDGTLMHGGMYFDVDVGIAMRAGRLERLEMVRVEHYGKGAPDWATEFTRPRAVPAVTGAFISSDAAWFAKLGGFSEDYVFGHYEDADLCLKSLVNGAPVWMHDLKLWHLEGKGSTRRALHEGGSIVNRWLFLSRWSKALGEGLIGPRPSHPAFSSAVRDARKPAAGSKS